MFGMSLLDETLFSCDLHRSGGSFSTITSFMILPGVRKLETINLLSCMETLRWHLCSDYFIRILAANVKETLTVHAHSKVPLPIAQSQTH